MPGLASLQCCSATNELVRAMTHMHKMYGALIASLGAVALMLAANETFARPAAAPRGGVAPGHSVSRPAFAHALRHHRRNFGGIFWPAEGGFFYEPPTGEPVGDVTPPMSGDTRYTYTYDVPWDWAHRYPPAVAPSDRPYVSSCPAEVLKVPGHDGNEQTVSIMRCY
jgi:hypothetical protein